MWPLPCVDSGIVDVLDSVRGRLADVLATLRRAGGDAAALTGQVAWDSAAAREFRIDADALVSDVSALAAAVEVLSDDLDGIRSSVLLRLGWTCS